jgi:hypothetical protein
VKKCTGITQVLGSDLFHGRLLDCDPCFTGQIFAIAVPGGKRLLGTAA